MNEDCEELAAQAAASFRAEQGLGLAPIADLITLIELARGVDVAVLEANGDDEHGVSMTDPASGITMIAVAALENPMRWRSTLAHELGHLVFEDHLAQLNGEPAVGVEDRARAFARHLLLPLDATKRLAPKAHEVDQATLSTIMQTYLVSPPIAAIQLRDAGCIDWHLSQQWQQLDVPEIATRFGWTDQYLALQGESMRRRAPQKLLQRATRGYIDGVLSIEALAGIRGIPVEQMAAELEQAGIVPVDYGRETTAPIPFEQGGGPVDLSWLDDLG